MLGSLMEDKRLDLNAPLLSVRRHVSGPLPPPPSSLSSSSFANGAAAVANSGAEGGGRAAAGQGTRRSSLPFYKSDLKSGPVRNSGAVPFVWEQFPGRPKDGSGDGDGDAPVKPVGGPLVARKLPPGRIPRRLSDEQEGPIRRDASDGANDGLPQRRSNPMSSASTSTAPTSSAATTTATSVNESFFTSSGSSRDVPKVNLRHSIEKSPTWEEQPGSCDGGDEEEDAFSDALSRVDTFSMNCSISGLSAEVDSREPSGTFSTDPGLRDFMMGRFLPAAQAMAASPSPYAARKPSVPSREQARRVIGKVGDGRRQSVPLPYQHRPSHVLNYASVYHQTNTGNSDDEEDDDEEDDEYSGSGHLSVKGCGLLPRFCLKSSFCLLNPVPGMKVRGSMPMPAARRRRPQVKASNHGSVGEAEDEHTWKEVYEHKLGRVHQIRGEEASKMTSESNQLSYWSDSQTADGSSSFRRSTGGAISPCRNGVSRTPLREWKNFGVPNHGITGSEDDEVFDLSDKSGEKYWEAMPHRSSSQTSGSQSPVVEKTVYVDSLEVLEDPGFRLSLSDTKSTLDDEGKHSEIVGKSKRVEESLMLEACDGIVAQHKLTEVVDADELHFAERSGAVEIMGNAEDDVLDVPRHLEAEDQGKNHVNVMQALLPPPLPKSPSESWLWRTLPSVASKNSAPLSLLGIQHYPKKQVDRASPTDPKRETIIKKSGVTKRQMRFADVLAKPASED